MNAALNAEKRKVVMNGKELVDWIRDEDHGRRMAGVYLAGFLHGQIACEARVAEFSTILEIPYDFSASEIIELVLKVAHEDPDLLDLDIGTFMYAVFDKELSEAGARQST